MGGWGPTHYVVTPTQVEVELRLSWALTKSVVSSTAELNHGCNQTEKVDKDNIYLLLNSL